MRAEENLVAENARLRRENQELRDTNELLKAASAFSCPNQARASEMIEFIDEYLDRFSARVHVCDAEHGRQGGFLTSRGYRDSKRRALSARQIKDRELVVIVEQIHAENYAVYGVGKIWHALTRCGVQVGRGVSLNLPRRNPGDSAEAGDRSGVFNKYSTVGGGCVNGR